MPAIGVIQGSVTDSSSGLLSNMHLFLIDNHDGDVVTGGLSKKMEASI